MSKDCGGLVYGDSMSSEEVEIRREFERKTKPVK